MSWINGGALGVLLDGEKLSKAQLRDLLLQMQARIEQLLAISAAGAELPMVNYWPNLQALPDTEEGDRAFVLLGSAPGVYRLGAGGWTKVADLPPGLSGAVSFNDVTLTGNAYAPTPPEGSSGAQIATAEFVRDLFDTLKKIPAQQLAALKHEVLQVISFEAGRSSTYEASMPGLALLHYAKSYEGPVSVLDELPTDDTEATSLGVAARLDGAGQIVRSQPMSLEGGRKWKIRAKMRRTAHSAYPNADQLRVVIYWLNGAQTSAGITVTQTPVNAGNTHISVDDGWVTVEAVLAGEGLAGVDHHNPQAVFARVGVEQNGGTDLPRAQVLHLSQTDVTDSEIVSDVAADMELRVSMLEAASPFTGLALTSGGLDDLFAAGQYYITDPVDGPAGAASFLGVSNTRINGQATHQEVWEATGNAGRRWWRAGVAGAWTAWQEVSSRAYVDQRVSELANSMQLGESGVLPPGVEIIAPGATGYVFTPVGSGVQGRYTWSRDRHVHVYGTLRFQVDYTAGEVPIYIAGLPVAAQLGGGDFEALATVKPAGNWVYPAIHKSTLGVIRGDRPDAIALAYEAEDTGLVSEVRNYALSSLPTGTELALSFSVSYLAVAP